MSSFVLRFVVMEWEVRCSFENFSGDVQSALCVTKECVKLWNVFAYASVYTLPWVA